MKYIGQGLRKAGEVSLEALRVDRTSRTPIHRQIYASIRAFILDRRIPSRAKLPASRDLAKRLGVGRNTVAAAYDQLQAEGLVEARPGSVTRVAELLTRTDDKRPRQALGRRAAVFQGGAR